MSLLLLPRELWLEVTARLDCIQRSNTVLALLAAQMDFQPLTLLYLSVSPESSRAEQIQRVLEWRRAQLANSLGAADPSQFWASTHHHCPICGTQLLARIIHRSHTEVYRINVKLETLYLSRWRELRKDFQIKTSAVYYTYLNYSYSSAHYSCGGDFMRTDIIRSPQPTELYKQCGTCHLRAQSTVPNMCRTCDRDYGVLPCSCGAAVCVECLKDPRHELLRPLCHVCLCVTCSVCSTPCRAEGCQKWLCIHCKDAPPSCEVNKPVPSTSVDNMAPSQSEEEVGFDGLFD